MSGNYDRIANYYDRIHHLFYGQAEISAQVELLDYVRPGDRLLILGGGTGWILEKIGARFPSGLDITYVESSARMMELTKRRDWGRNRVELVMDTVEDWEREGEGEWEGEWEKEGEGDWEGQKEREGEGEWEGVRKRQYDCVLTGLFFDNFKEAHARAIVQQVTPYLKTGGYWLESDFYYPKRRGKLWQAILLQMMYLSARIICGVEAKRLPDMDAIFLGEGYGVIQTAFHYQRFIRSVVFRKG